MALSLTCKDCNTLLRSVKEAQDHAEATGHSNFEESTQAVLKLVCTECSKACKSETEKELHTRRTGHSNFQDKTGEGDAINTEAEMAEARAELHGDEAAPAGAGAAPDAEDLIPAEVNEPLLETMLSMGFPRNRAVRAVYNSGGESADAAITWLAEHEDDGDLDDPLLVPRATAREKLTPEAAKAQAAELLRKAKVRREAEERERERLREQERIRSGKELAAVARQEEEARLRRIVEERRREKEEVERAREKIRQKLDQDRRERRLRLGLPEELTEEEKEEERRKEREKAEVEARRKLPVKPVAASEKMRQLLVDLKKSHAGQDDGVRTCFTTLLKMISNVATAPAEDKFRRIKLTNPAVQQRVGAFTGALDFLQLAGFRKDPSGEALYMPPEAVDAMLLAAAGENLTSSLNNPFFGML